MEAMFRGKRKKAKSDSKSTALSTELRARGEKNITLLKRRCKPAEDKSKLPRADEIKFNLLLMGPSPFSCCFCRCWRRDTWILAHYSPNFFLSSLSISAAVFLSTPLPSSGDFARAPRGRILTLAI